MPKSIQLAHLDTSQCAKTASKWIQVHSSVHFEQAALVAFFSWSHPLGRSSRARCSQFTSLAHIHPSLIMPLSAPQAEYTHHPTLLSQVFFAHFPTCLLNAHFPPHFWHSPTTCSHSYLEYVSRKYYHSK